MKFDYQARTKDGEIHSGQVEAATKEAAVSLLQKHGLYVTLLEESEVPFYARRIKFFERTSRKDVVLFSRELSIMFKSKVTLIESLKTLTSQTQNPNFKEKILKLSEEVESGTSFSDALSIYPQIFSPFYIAMVKSGEASGKLSEVLEHLADHLEREYHLLSKTRGALVYPALIVFMVIVVLVLMVTYVIPQLAAVLEASEEELPFLTRSIIQGAAFLRTWWWIILLGFGFIVSASVRYYLTVKGRKFFDKLFLKLPIVGSLSKQIYVARFAENLSTLISGGLPIAQAIETAGHIIGNTRYKEVIFEARDRVRKGEPVSLVLSQAPDIFPPIFVQMALVGEKTGTLDDSLMNIVGFYQKEIDRSIDSLLSILEPALLVILGVVVGGVILSILMPLYNMMTF